MSGCPACAGADGALPRSVEGRSSGAGPRVSGAGGGGGKLEVTISAAGAHVEGNVVDKDHKPYAGAMVVLVRVLTLGTPDPAAPDQNVVNGLGYM